MYNEGAPEFVVDQGLYYPTATNYGYICTGFESPGDWNDHHKVFGVDGQDIQYAGSQTENMPFVYYTPSYGYAQSPYNPYNPYIPGAMIGVDGPFVGTQQYYNIPSYENPVSSPAYFPMVVQSGPDIIGNGATDPFLNTAASISNRADGPGLKPNLSSAAATFGLTPSKPLSNQNISFTGVSEGPKVNVGSSKHTATHGSVTSGSFSCPASPQVFQGRGVHSVDNISRGKPMPNRNHLKIALPSGNGLSNFGSSVHGPATVDRVRSKFYYGRVPNDVNGSPDAYTEQNRGPRTSKSKNHLTVKAYTTIAENSDAQGNIIIYTDQYNKDDFPVDYANAKFFVIKSYSEDDVHKSIKYNVWSSTPNGNKKLNSAYEDAQRITAGKPGGCPIFLFFSVNASGQFCGVAEMTGPVDFHKDVDFWQQDKWSGSFPVRWHIIKDVPNPNFRQIVLENNENKSVTNSRDTQEIRYKKGLEMLKIFKNYISKTSLLDDFTYYENRQKILQEEKARLLIKAYETPFLVPLLDTPRKLNSVRGLPSSEYEKITKHVSDKNTAAPSEQVSLDPDASNPSIGNENANPIANEVNNNDTLKIGSLTINPRNTESKPSEVTAAAATATATVAVANAEPVDVVRVGSMPIKVNGFAERSGFLTVGTISLDPSTLQVNEPGASTKIGSQQG
ncbi:unnamed protein product [Ilex paraguariensis]|uniref:YTH domain-containing family protein n=1 Tax=Ilex paraguariensis TaxID=185542 RepID=A0ABC8T1X9_9AQUA